MNEWNDEKSWSYITPGIPDDMFIRGEVPMTKQEVRAVTLSKLKLKEDMIIWDVGAGTGSISIEAALQCKYSTVYAVERNAEGIRLINQNSKKFGTNNIDIIEGSAPQVLESLPAPDRVMIGGAGEHLIKLLDYTHTVLKSQGIIVTNCITIETMYDTLHWLEIHEYQNIDGVCVSVSRTKKAGARHMFQALNPVYIISGMKGEKA